MMWDENDLKFILNLSQNLMIRFLNLWTKSTEKHHFKSSTSGYTCEDFHCIELLNHITKGYMFLKYSSYIECVQKLLKEAFYLAIVKQSQP